MLDYGSGPGTVVWYYYFKKKEKEKAL